MAAESSAAVIRFSNLPVFRLLFIYLHPPFCPFGFFPVKIPVGPLMYFSRTLSQKNHEKITPHV
jgi:hypothetical protein